MPEAGSPPRETEPVGTEQVGWTMDAITGADGVRGAAFMTILAEGPEVHPLWVVTV